MSDEDVLRAYIGLHGLDALGVHNRVLLDGFADCNGGNIDVAKFLSKNGQAGRACVSFPE